MRFIFSAVTGIILLAAIIFFAVPLFISAEDVRNQLFAQVESATGYRLRVDGPVKISMFPSLDLVAEDVGISQPASGDTGEFATAQKLRFGLMLRGLLSGKVQMTELTLVDPVIAPPQSLAAEAPAPEGPESGAGTLADTLRNLSLDKLVIENGTVILPESQGTPGKRIEALMLEASLPSIDDPLTFDAAATVDGKTFQAEGSIGSFGRFIEGAAVPVSFALDAPSYIDQRANFTGTAGYTQGALTVSQFSATAGNDKLTGESASYKDDVLTLNQVVANYEGNVFAGSAVYKDDVLMANPITIEAGGHTLTGGVTARLSDAVPAVGLSLTADTLDLNKLLGNEAGTASTGGSSAGGAAGWSDAPIDFSPLKAVNANFKLAIGGLIYDKITVSSATIDGTLSGGKLALQVPSFTLYNGSGTATAVVDASGKVPAHRLQMSLSGVDAHSFLSDAVAFRNIEGKGAANLDLTASGGSQRAIVSNLNGTAALQFTEGAIRGTNLINTLRNVATGVVTGWQLNEEARTAFTTLGATFNVANGQATTEDLQLKGPLLQMGGTGTIDLPAKTLKFRVNPMVLASAESQDGKASHLGFPVPVAISGPWASPKIYPDIAGVLENPVAAYQQLNKLGGGLIALPAGLVGIDTGEGGLVEKGTAIPSALTRGAIEGLGQILGGKKRNEQADDLPLEGQPQQDMPEMQPAAATPQGEPPQDLSGGQPAEAMPASEAPAGAPVEAAQEPADAGQAAAPVAEEQKPKRKRRSESKDAAEQLLQGIFGN